MSKRRIEIAIIPPRARPFLEGAAPWDESLCHPGEESVVCVAGFEVAEVLVSTVVGIGVEVSVAEDVVLGSVLVKGVVVSVLSEIVVSLSSVDVMLSDDDPLAGLDSVVEGKSGDDGYESVEDGSPVYIAESKSKPPSQSSSEIGGGAELSELTETGCDRILPVRVKVSKAVTKIQQGLGCIMQQPLGWIGQLLEVGVRLGRQNEYLFLRMYMFSFRRINISSKGREKVEVAQQMGHHQMKDGSNSQGHLLRLCVTCSLYQS